VRTHSDALSTEDGLKLPTRGWLPDEPGSERAVILVVHGFGEHIGRYDRLATRLVREGYAVHGFDLRGHGYAPGVRANIDHFDRYARDLAAFEALVAPLHPGKPVVLFGHSMGGVVAARALQLDLVKPQLLVLSSPALVLGAEVAQWLRRLLALIARPFPNLPTVRLDTRQLSRDLAEVRAYDTDPAVFHGPVKARIASEMARAGAQAIAEGGRIEVPTLILHGKDDKVTLASGSAALMGKLSGRDALLKLYDEGPHELFHDGLRDRVTADLLAWFAERL
jgi:alpha-beta hydrolase superfamily lysophospholipase